MPIFLNIKVAVMLSRSTKTFKYPAVITAFWGAAIMPNFTRVANVSDLKPGENKVVNANGTEVALFNVDGEFFAISNTCLHRGGPLGEGMLDGDVVTCPWHGWRFNVKTGISPVMPTAKIATHQVKVEGNDVMVAVD